MEEFLKIFDCKCDWNIERDSQTNKKIKNDNIRKNKQNNKYLNAEYNEHSFIKNNFEEKNTRLLSLSFSEIHSYRSKNNYLDVSRDLFDLKNSFK